MRRRKNTHVVGYIKTDLVKEFPVYAHSGTCVISKSVVTSLTANAIRLYGELSDQKHDLLYYKLVINRDFFVVNRAGYINITGSAQSCNDTVMISTSGLRKLSIHNCLTAFGKERAEDAIKQLEDIERKLFKKTAPDMKVVITEEAIVEPKCNSIPKVVALNKPISKDVIDIIVDRVIERIADQAMERLLRA